MDHQRRYHDLPLLERSIVTHEMFLIYHDAYLQMVGSANEAGVGLIQPQTLEIATASVVRKVRIQLDALAKRYGIKSEAPALTSELESRGV